ncbi:FixH family protein [Bernardetia sp. ABR2-2B]|uniref:FixH family protein n=1 Tax=Bernardetia sp. ABR2-2B TaxID=3127472 RepID=UPI0030CA7D87
MNILTTLWNKFNWGTGIFLFYSAFVIFMLSLVFMSMQQKIELVTENYYTEGIDFQRQINERKNVAALKAKPTIKQLENGNVEIKFPVSDSLDVDKITGQIAFFRPSDKDLDFSLPIKLTKPNHQLITEKIEQGLWKVKLSWTQEDRIGNNKKFFQETILVASN